MADFLSELANQAGVNSDLANKGFGAVMGLLKDKLGSSVVDSVQAAIPDAKNAVSAYEKASKENSGGMFGALAGAAGSLLGGSAGELAAAVAKFTKVGFSMEDLQKFIPTLLKLLQGKLPDGVFQQIQSALAGLLQGSKQ